MVVLDQVVDPRNLGACIRSAAAAQATALILPRARTARSSATARQVARGGAEVIPIVEVANLVRALERLKELGLWVMGLSEQAPLTLWECDLTVPTAWVLGGEHRGLRRLVGEHCDQLVRIPTSETLASLNVASAASIALFESSRQRRASKPLQPPATQSSASPS